ncbi:unnamed protein product [Amaranthus hypochondriacus]
MDIDSMSTICLMKCLNGMMINGSLNLTSWSNPSNPASGPAHFLLQPGNNGRMFINEDGYPKYWDSRADPSAQIPPVLSKLLNDVNGKSSLPNNTRLVMNFTVQSGQIQLWKRGFDGSWLLDWVEPKDRCSFDTVCGNFGSCNNNSGLPCKCLPGFKPSSLLEWNLGCFSGGCVPESGAPAERQDSNKDTFLRLPMMKVGGLDCSTSIEDALTEEDCKHQCLFEITCVAFSYGSANCNGTHSPTEKRCLIWYGQLGGLQEEYSQGLTIFVRTPSSNIEPSSRHCKPCGAYAIPYPLSTNGTNCGDSSYRNLHCNSETGQVNFSSATGTFRVTLINPNNFTIQVMHANSCDSEYLNSFIFSPNSHLPFYIKNCTIFKDNPFIQLGQPFIEVDIGWQPPPEPSCSTISDCFSWPETSCKATKGGERRCMCRSNFHWDGSNLNCVRVPSHLKVVFACIAAVLAVILLLFGAFLICQKCKRRIAEKKGSINFREEETEGLDIPFFSWGSILAATNIFADENKLGTGGFGSVYRGKLPDGREIAVKRLSTVSNQGVAEFRTEVVLIAKLQHRNLVRLLGYCVKSNENILVYEYMPNGSLDSCLFDQTFSVYLDWGKRFDIIFGIARGLVYLHQDSRLRVVHRDLKPSNILLDEDLNPKISDFGIARIVGGKEAEATTNKVVGTYGYMSPEYACEGFFSFKSDVFSFGVVVLETISGRRNSRSTMFEQGLGLLGHAWRLWNEDRALELIDPSLKESCNHTEVLKCIHVGLLCVQDEPSDRPSMSTVILMLSSESTAYHSLPKKPVFFSRSSSETAASTSSLGGSSFFSNLITVSTVGR